MSNTHNHSRKGSVYLPTVGSEFDFYRRTSDMRPSHKLMFATLPRSGSHFICQKFFESGRAGLPLEYFNPAHWNRWRVRIAAEAAGRTPDDASRLGELATLADKEMPRASNRHTLGALIRRRTGPNGCFSVKLHYSNVRHLTSIVSDKWMEDAHWIRIERLNILAQAVSLEIAVQTGSWIFSQKAWRTPVYDYLALRRRLIRILRDRHAWSCFFKERGIQPHIICYEEFVSNPTESVTTVLDRINKCQAPTPLEAELPYIPEIESQSSTINVKWTERFAEELGKEIENPPDLLP